MNWPYPGDSPAVRTKRVALAYRQRLLQVAPEACAELDETMRQLGQHWAIPRPVNADPDAWVNARDAAELAALDGSTLRSLRRRGRLRGRQLSARKWEYRVGDLMALATLPRTRHKQGKT